MAEQQEPEKYQTLQDMFLGSVISASLYTDESYDISELKTRKFKNCQVFLDSNFVFYILDMERPEFCLPAKELLILLKNNLFDIKVFDI